MRRMGPATDGFEDGGKGQGPSPWASYQPLDPSRCPWRPRRDLEILPHPAVKRSPPRPSPGPDCGRGGTWAFSSIWEKQGDDPLPLQEQCQNNLVKTGLNKIQSLIAWYQNVLVSVQNHSEGSHTEWKRQHWGMRDVRIIEGFKAAMTKTLPWTVTSMPKTGAKTEILGKDTEPNGCFKTGKYN